MCIQDLAIGRRSGSGMKVVAVTTTPVQLVEANDDRTAIVFCGNLGAALTVSLLPAAVAGEGMVIDQPGSPVTLDIFKHGDLVRRAWFGVIAAGTENFAVFETIASRSVSEAANRVQI